MVYQPQLWNNFVYPSQLWNNLVYPSQLNCSIIKSRLSLSIDLFLLKLSLQSQTFENVYYKLFCNKVESFVLNRWVVLIKIVLTTLNFGNWLINDTFSNHLCDRLLLHMCFMFCIKILYKFYLWFIFEVVSNIIGIMS